MYHVILNTFVIITAVTKINCADDLLIRKDGSYKYGYAGPDSFHESQANRNNVVRGKFGGRNPETGRVDQITYTAGPRGYRPRGDNVVRKYDLGQTPIGPIGSRDDPYYDPNEDPSYHFKFRTRTYERDEGADSKGDVRGRYSYIDDVGERHNVEYIAGSRTGFRVRTPYPDSNLRLYGRLFINGRGKPLPRGRTSIQQRGDGSYKFISAGPDQRRVETSDASGYVTGSYTYLDDKGVQHTVNYEAGPEIGYRIIKATPSYYPFRYPSVLPPEPPLFGKDDDLFDTAASGPIKPIDGDRGGGTKPGGGDGGYNEGFPSTTTRPSIGGSTTTRRPIGGGGDTFGGGGGGDTFGGGGGDAFGGGGGDMFGGGDDTFGSGGGGSDQFGGGGSKPSYSDEEDEDIGDLFDTNVPGGTTPRPPSTSVSPGRRPARPPVRPTGRPLGRPTGRPSGRPTGRPTTDRPRPSYEDYDDGSYKPDDGSYGRPISRPRPTFDDGSYKPSEDESGYRPARPRPTYDYEDNFNDVNDDFGIFGKPTTNRPFSTRPPIHVGISTDSDSRRPGGGRRPGGTIVTNVGDELFSVPPGVSVRAHVQAIDLLPLNAKILSPTDQYKAELQNRDSANAESNVVANDATTTTEQPTTISTTSSTTTTTQETSTAVS